MATATKKKKDIVTEPTTSLFVRGKTKADGTPWGTRRSNDEMLAVYQGKLVSAKARHEKEIAKIEKKIAYFSNAAPSRKIDPEQAKAAAQELIAGGMTIDQITAFAEKARLAVAAIKGKSEEEINALIAPPPFLAVTPAE